MRAFTVFCGVLLCAAVTAWTDTTIDPEHPYAYGANVGWINTRGDVTHGAAVGEHYCSGYLWSANCGWIGLGNGPANGWQYANNASSDWGVNHDGQGGLTGYAYGANIGWVAFEQSHGKPRINLATGNLSGYVWGANVGWISLSNAQAHVRSVSLDPGPDGDGDGIPDAWELRQAANTTTLQGGEHDQDGDGASDAEEYLADTDPLSGADSLRIMVAETDGNSDTLTWPARPTRQYRLVRTNALPVSAVDWDDAGTGLMGPPAGSPMTQPVPSGADAKRFYRVKALVPLSE